MKRKTVVIILVVIFGGLAVCAIPIIIMLHSLSVVIDIFFDETEDFETLKNEREQFAYAVERGDVSIEDTGMIELPEEYSHLSAGGICCVVDNSVYDIAIYYMEFNGVTDSSRGYLYKLEKVDEYIKERADDSFHFTNYKTLSDRWTSCSTD